MRGSLLAALVVLGLVILVPSCNAVLAALTANPQHLRRRRLRRACKRTRSSRRPYPKVENHTFRAVAARSSARPGPMLNAMAATNVMTCCAVIRVKRHTKPGTNDCVLQRIADK